LENVPVATKTHGCTSGKDESCCGSCVKSKIETAKKP
jgi:hypothetical protein